jgi:hypothetical protein
VNERLHVAQQAESRGGELMEAAKHTLAGYGDIDAAIIQHRATKFKHAAAGEGPAPDMRLPDDLAKRRQQREDARDVLAAAKAAHDSLAGELAQAETAMRKAEARVSEQAVAVLVEEANAQAAALKATWQTLWATVDALNALAASWLPGPVRLPPDVVATLQLLAGYDHRQFAGNFNTGLKRAGERWRAWHRALCNDADAEMPETVEDNIRSTVIHRVA